MISQCSYTRLDSNSFVYSDIHNYAGGRGERYEYNDFGFREKVFDVRYDASHPAIYSVERTDVWGNVIEAVARNGMVYRSSYDRGSGALLDRTDSAERGLGTEFGQITTYEWDAAGRLGMRFNYAYGYEGGTPSVPHAELFEYDTRDRLLATLYTTQPNDPIEQWQLRQSTRYNEAGNILCKSDVHWNSSEQLDCRDTGSDYYTYGFGVGQFGEGGPHAVTSANIQGQWRDFEYDATGNLETEGLRQFTYTGNRRLASSVSVAGSERADYFYGAGQQKRLRVTTTSDGFGTPETTYVFYVGEVQIEVDLLSGDVPIQILKYEKHLENIALLTEYPDTGVIRTLYKHVDHQGSLVALSDENGRVTSRMSFDPWGNRRALDENGWHQWLQLTQSLPMAWDQKFRSMLSWTERGYTGHEHVDGLGFIHMGGRIYDPMLGRFLQADPFMEDTGTLNRYTYVHNNPLGWVDPSGFRARRGNYTRMTSQFKRDAAYAFISVATFGVSAYYTAMDMTAKAAFAAGAGGTVGTYVRSGSLRQAFIVGASAALSYGATQGLGDSAVGYVARGVIGGAAQQASGGDFASGFASSVFAAAVAPQIASQLPGSIEVQFLAATVLGGVASEIGGGKFAMGAVMASYDQIWCMS